MHQTFTKCHMLSTHMKSVLLRIRSFLCSRSCREQSKQYLYITGWHWMTTRFNVLETDYERGIILNLCALFLFLLYPAHRASPSSESSRHFLLLPFEAAYSPHIPTPGAYYSVVIMSSLLLRPPFSPVVSPGALLLTVVCR